MTPKDNKKIREKLPKGITKNILTDMLFRLNIFSGCPSAYPFIPRGASN